MDRLLSSKQSLNGRQAVKNFFTDDVKKKNWCFKIMIK